MIDPHNSACLTGPTYAFEEATSLNLEVLCKINEGESSQRVVLVDPSLGYIKWQKENYNHSHIYVLLVRIKFSTNPSDHDLPHIHNHSTVFFYSHVKKSIHLPTAINYQKNTFFFYIKNLLCQVCLDRSLVSINLNKHFVIVCTFVDRTFNYLFAIYNTGVPLGIEISHLELNCLWRITKCTKQKTSSHWFF